MSKDIDGSLYKADLVIKFQLRLIWQSYKINFCKNIFERNYISLSVFDCESMTYIYNMFQTHFPTYSNKLEKLPSSLEEIADCYKIWQHIWKSVKISWFFNVLINVFVEFWFRTKSKQDTYAVCILLQKGGGVKKPLDFFRLHLE